MRNNKPEDVRKVAEVQNRPQIKTGKPGKVITSTMMRSKTAFSGSGGGVTQGSGGNFYSPELSTDFLELPQSLDEQRNYYRIFYRTNPLVGQAIDLRTELPLSKIRLGMPRAKNRELAKKSLLYCEKWAKKIGLLQRLIEITHDYNLIGEVFIFAEDNSPDMPRDLVEECVREIDDEGTLHEKWVKRPDGDELAVAWVKKNYHGWSAIRVLPPEQVHMESFPFTDEKIFELIPDSKTKNLIAQADQGDLRARKVVESMPPEITNAIREGSNIPLNTDPDAGSFVYYLANKRSQYEARGQSPLERCLLPGTPIWIKREGIIQQVAVEEVDPETDLLLTHKGRFRKAKKGSRPVNEKVTVLSIEGVSTPLALTSDHPVLRMTESGKEEWIEAGKLQKGDQVRESHVAAQQGMSEEIDLKAWWKGRVLGSKRRSNNKPERSFHASEVGETSNDALVVTFEYEQDNPSCVASRVKKEKLLCWLQSLPGPTQATYEAVQGVTGLTRKEISSAISILRQEQGLRTENHGQGLIWWPLPASAVIPGAKVFATEISSRNKLQLTEDFCYLLGSWLGDGDVLTSEDPFLNVKSLGWTFGKNETETAVRERVLASIEQCLGTENLTFENPFSDRGDSRTECIRIEDPLLARWFMEEFGHTAQGKRIPEWVFGLPEHFISALLKGVLDTDGWLGLGQASQISVVLDNKVLIDQLHLLCNRVGIQTQVGVQHKKAFPWSRQWGTKSGLQEKTYQYEAKDFHKLACGRHEDVLAWANGSVKGSLKEWPKRDRAWESNFKGDVGWLTRKIAATEQIPYQGPVYSFDVEEDESHVTGSIVTHNCLRTLVFADKCRQAQTSIASRHMTPYRLIWGENMNAEQTEELREQVDLALADPDFSIITNFQVNWEEKGGGMENRLMDMATEYDRIDKELYAGLGVTESLLSGEGSYSGDRINLEVINVRFMYLREVLQDLVEMYFFKPMCARMGFVEEDEDGNVEVIVPKLTFTRLALRDNNDTYEALFNLYAKGSLDIDVILDLLNIDPETTRDKLQRDVFTMQDPMFNELIRNIYNSVAQKLVDGTDITEKLSGHLKLKYEAPKGDDRFGGG